MCYTGTFGRVNDMMFLTKLLVQYCSENNQINFILIGAGKDYEACLNYVSEVGLSERIIIIPQVTKDIAFLVTKNAIASFCFVEPIRELLITLQTSCQES